MATALTLEIVADYVCPWCYLGYAVAERLQQQVPLVLKCTPFPLHPATPPEGLLLSELLRGMDLAAVHARLYRLMDDLGLEHGERERTYNSRLAQELGKWADTQPAGAAVHGLLYRSYFVQGRNLAELPVLLDVVAAAGLDVESARQALLQRRFAADVDADWQRVRHLGISGVPTFIASGYQFSGFQPLTELQRFVDFVRQQADQGR